MCRAALPGDTASPAQHRLMDRMIDAGFAMPLAAGQAVVVTGRVATGAISVRTA